MEIDSQKNILRGVATGATELRTKNINEQDKTIEELTRIVSESAGVGPENVTCLAQVGSWNAFSAEHTSKAFFGLIKKRNSVVRVVDNTGVIRLQKSKAGVKVMKKSEIDKKLLDLVDEMTVYNDGGAMLPKCFMYFRRKAVELSGVVQKEQLLPLIALELEYVPDEEEIFVVAAQS